MKACINVELRPLSVPDVIGVGDGRTTVPISSLDSSTLESLCDEFKTIVFKKPGKCRPPQKLTA